MREFMRLRPIISVVFIVGLILPFFITQGGAEYTTPIVWSNKKEYDPSETAYLYGYGFKPFAQINITIIRPDLVEDKVQTLTDEFGYFSYQYPLDGIHGVYEVTATDGVNVATTTFDNWLSLSAWWDTHDSIYIYAKASGLSTSKQYYIKYFDPSGVEKRKSPTYTGVLSFQDNLTILPTFSNIFGYWNVKLYKNNTLKRTKTVYIDKIVWTTDPTYTILDTSFAQGETVYFKTMGLRSYKYYRFMLEMPNKTKIYVGSWTTGVTSMTGSYPLPSNAPLGTWKLHVREADDVSGTYEHHYVDCRFEVTTAPPPQQYYLTVQTEPPGIGAIPGEGWYNACTFVNLTAPEFFPGPTGSRYRFNNWDVDGTPNATGVQEITVHMDANHTATAHYITQYFLNLTTNPPGVTTPAGVGWYDAGTNAPIFAPEFVSIVPGASRYRFSGWTTGDMSEIANASATSTTVFMDKAKTVTANYMTQYYLTVISPYGTPSGEGWYNASTTAYATLNTGVVDHGNGTRRVFNNWGGDASGTNYAQSDPITMDGPKTAIANWRTEYRLTVRTSGLGTYVTNVYNTTTTLGTATDATPYTGWFEEGSQIMLDIDSPITDGSKRFVFTNWSGDATGTSRPVSVTMNTVKDITANYKTQYQITVTASPGGALEGTFKVTYTQCGTTYTNVQRTTQWTDWADASTTVTVSEPQDVINGPPGTRYKFDSYNPSASVTMDQTKTLTLVYKTQYYLTVNTNPAEVLTLNPAAVSGQGWYDNGATATVDAVQNVDKVAGQSRYDFRSWTGAIPTGVGNRATVFMDGPKTATVNYQLQYYLTVTSPYGIVGGQGWYDSGATAYATLNTDIVDHGNKTRRVFISWSGDASGTNYAQSNPITMSGPKTAVANWKTQYLLTVQTNPAGLSPQPTRNPAGEAGPANSWWYDASINVTLTAQPVTDYTFNYWDVDGASKGTGVNPINVTMNTYHTATAYYTQIGPLSVSITPTTAKIKVGESVSFTSSVSGGKPPYTSYQWYLNGIAVSGATSSSWTFTPTASGIYYVYLKVTDANGNVAQSETARITVGAVPVGGYSISLTKQTPASRIAAYVMLIALFGAALSLTKRKRK